MAWIVKNDDSDADHVVYGGIVVCRFFHFCHPPFVLQH